MQQKEHSLCHEMTPLSRVRSSAAVIVGVNDEAWIQALLQRASIGMLAPVHDGQPWMNRKSESFE
jgi:hypothetical protein